MGKVILFNMVSLDGFFEGPNKELDWHTVDNEFHEFSLHQLDEAGGLLFGRVTYQLMADYWQTEEVKSTDAAVAHKMNTLPKIVFSNTLPSVEWNNTRLVKSNAGGEVAKLKHQPGKDLLLLGSSELAATLTGLGLIDEYRLMISPVVLGGGKPHFGAVADRLKLQLMTVKTFRSGTVLLAYKLKN